MATTTTPTYTGNAAGNVRSSSSLAASGTANYDLDFSAVFEGQIHIKNTPGSSISGTRGLKVEVFRSYGSTPTVAQTSTLAYTLPSAVASTAESLDIYVPTGHWNVKVTNLDGSQAVTVEITSDTVTSLGTS
jgi:hypothetical protein